jgi:hypothetical protein
MKSVAMPNVMIPQAYTITLDWSVPRNEIPPSVRMVAFQGKSARTTNGTCSHYSLHSHCRKLADAVFRIRELHVPAGPKTSRNRGRRLGFARFFIQPNSFIIFEARWW